MRRLAVLLGLLQLPVAQAHPGSGIAVDTGGRVYFADSGKGIWSAAPDVRLRLVSNSALHWLAMAPRGTPLPAAGGYFEHVSPSGTDVVLVLSSDFPCAVAADGSVIFADTRAATRIVRRTPSGDEKPLAQETFHLVTGLAIAPDGAVVVLDLDPETDAHAVFAIDAVGSVKVLARDFVPLPIDSNRQPGSIGRGIACDQTGAVFVAATAARAVMRVDRDGRSTTVLRSERPWSPTGVAVHGDAIYVLEYTDTPAGADGSDRSVWVPRVRKLSANGAISTVAAVRR